jgi:hypothetical protein
MVDLERVRQFVLVAVAALAAQAGAGQHGTPEALRGGAVAAAGERFVPAAASFPFVGARRAAAGRGQVGAARG